MSLADGRHRLGRDCDNDVVLADDRVAERQALVEIADARAVLVPLAPGARLADRTLVPGKAMTLRDGARVVMGDTALRFHGPRPGWRDRARAPLPWAGLAASCVVATLSLVPLHLGATTTVQPGAARPDQATVGQRTASDEAGPGGTPLHRTAAHRMAAHGTARVEPDLNAPDQREPGQHDSNLHDTSLRQPGASRTALARALTLLQGRLADAGLERLVEVAAADGAVLATGALKPADRDRWLGIQMWFDSTAQDHVTLVDKVDAAPAEDAPQLDIRAVSMGAVPFLITASGDRYAEGAILPHGWTIGRIAAERVTLLNGSRTVDITL